MQDAQKVSSSFGAMTTCRPPTVNGLTEYDQPFCGSLAHGADFLVGMPILVVIIPMFVGLDQDFHLLILKSHLSEDLGFSLHILFMWLVSSVFAEQNRLSKSLSEAQFSLGQLFVALGLFVGRSTGHRCGLVKLGTGPFFFGCG